MVEEIGIYLRLKLESQPGIALEERLMMRLCIPNLVFLSIFEYRINVLDKLVHNRYKSYFGFLAL